MITTKKTLSLLIQLADGLAAQFGTDCEVVIHDLTKRDMEHTIAYIINGHVSNREPGDGPSAIVLETLNKNPDTIHDQLAYLTKTSDGRILKSSTMYIRGEKNQIQYIFAMNFDITCLMTLNHTLNTLIDTYDESNHSKSPKRITNNVNDLLDDLIQQSVEIIGKPVALMTKDDKIAAIQFLNDAGAFLITKSGDKVSSYFGISKFTLYSYMDAAKQPPA